jgi:hypothetical protein
MYFPYEDMFLTNSHNDKPITVSSDFLAWIFISFSSLFFLGGLWMYTINYIVSGRLAEDSIIRKQTVYIVRRLPSDNLDEKIAEFIKKNAKRPYKILSTKTYDNNVTDKDERVFMRFMKRIYKTDSDIYLMNSNLDRTNYDNYIYFSEIMSVDYKILDFVRNDGEGDNTELNRLNRENRERITIRLD